MIIGKHNTAVYSVVGQWRQFRATYYPTAQGNIATNKSENYVPGDSGKRIAMFPEGKDVRYETKNSFKGAKVKGDSYG